MIYVEAFSFVVIGQLFCNEQMRSRQLHERSYQPHFILLFFSVSAFCSFSFFFLIFCLFALSCSKNYINKLFLKITLLTTIMNISCVGKWET